MTFWRIYFIIRMRKSDIRRKGKLLIINCTPSGQFFKKYFRRKGSEGIHLCGCLLNVLPPLTEAVILPLQ